MNAVNSRVRGFTMIELLTVIAVAAVLIMVAAPFFGNATLGGQLSSHATNLLSAFNLAKTEATKRNTSVSVCASSDGATCASSGTWDQGWIVFVDPNRNAVVDSGENIISSQPAAPNGFRIAETLNSARNVRVPPFGVMTPSAFCVYREAPAYGAQERKVNILATGQARITKSTNGNGTCT